jgi:glycosyltransferase involved in cell wall biosynthesis
VLPSRYDGWGVVVNQALGAGLPIIASDQVGAAHDLITPGENGFPFPAGDVTALGEMMRRFTDHPELCETMSAASRARAAEWTPERGAERWLQALKKVTT